MPQPYVRAIDRINEFELPRPWQMLSNTRFNEHGQKGNISKIWAKALPRPIAWVRPEEKPTPDSTVAIITEGLTRKSPKIELLAHHLKCLQEIGINRDNITIIISLGTHHPLTREEQEAGYGQEVVVRYRVVNHDSKTADLMLNKFFAMVRLTLNDYKVIIGERGHSRSG